MRSTFVSALASSAAMVALLMACTTTTTTVVEGTDASTTSGDAGKKDGSATTTEEDAAVEETGDDACGGSSSLEACVTCCGTNHKAGETAQLQMILACVCQGTGAKDAGANAPCAAACGATICASTPKNPDAACNSCLQAAVAQGGACYDGVSQACLANKDCSDYNTCNVQQCASKQ